MSEDLIKYIEKEFNRKLTMQERMAFDWTYNLGVEEGKSKAKESIIKLIDKYEC